MKCRDMYSALRPGQHHVVQALYPLDVIVVQLQLLNVDEGLEIAYLHQLPEAQAQAGNLIIPHLRPQLFIHVLVHVQLHEKGLDSANKAY